MFRSKDFNRFLLGIGFVVLCGVLGVVVNRDVVETQDVASPVIKTPGMASLQALPKRQILQQIYTAEIGVRELTNKNDGKRIGEYLGYVGLPQGYAHCAAFVSWAFGQAGFAEPKTAWSPALFPQKRIIWERGKGPVKTTGRDARSCVSTEPRIGDIFGIYFSELKRIAHCGFVDSWGDTWCITVESNTNDVGSLTFADDPANPIRAGPSNEGVYRKKRLIRTIYKVADWVR